MPPPFTCEWNREKAKTLQNRLKKYDGRWLVFLDDPIVPPTNKLADRSSIGCRPVHRIRPIAACRALSGYKHPRGQSCSAPIISDHQETSQSQLLDSSGDPPSANTFAAARSTNKSLSSRAVFDISLGKRSPPPTGVPREPTPLVDRFVFCVNEMKCYDESPFSA